MTEAVTTYMNDPSFKAAFLAEIGKHEAADAFVKGSYGRMNSHFKGCAIGCSVVSLRLLAGEPIGESFMDHARVSRDLGVPIWLAHAEDTLFEHLPEALSKTWPRRLAEAIPVGVTVPDLVLAKLLRWMLVDETYGVLKCCDTAATKRAVLGVAALFERECCGEVVPESEWAAEAARAAGAARAAFYPALSDELLRLLRELGQA